MHVDDFIEKWFGVSEASASRRPKGAEAQAGEASGTTETN